ncbi:Serine carboxypeptidase-like 51 [Camellia lanceoleosa]|uniref:Serine carboxypeptidase-like 51 n=1 Tax=Camellia lanceoleosa TaxID=1840588 RepID=A0ACC0HVA5_9ERIC|nr:Serine carboxypeptidase-like 51 [Camellia lanceoleosa]
MLEALFNGNETLQKSHLFIIAESHGGKFAVTLGLLALKAIEAGELKLQLGGGPLLKDLSQLDSNALYSSNSLAQNIKKEIAEGKYEAATNTWEVLENFISANSNDVDFYNFMLDHGNDPVESRTFDSNGLLVDSDERAYKTEAIPENVTWDGQGGIVFSAMAGDFMKPRIKEQHEVKLGIMVDKLLAKGVNVTIYNGQIDLICATKGTEAWVDKLKWEGLKNYLNLSRTPSFWGEDNITTKAFVRSYKNLLFYWILGASHFVPVDQPCISLQMITK